MSGPCEWIIDKLCGGLSVMEQYFPVSSDKGDNRMRQLAGQRQTRSQRFYRASGQNGCWYHRWAWVEIMINCAPTCKTSQWQNDVLNAILWQQPRGGVATCPSHHRFSIWQKWENWHLRATEMNQKPNWNISSESQLLVWLGLEPEQEPGLFYSSSPPMKFWTGSHAASPAP